MIEQPTEAYPLTWPTGRPRAAAHQRREGVFKVTFGQALNDLRTELQRLGAQSVIISSNMPLRRDGLPYSDAPETMPDPGIAVYFQRRGKGFVVACDSFRRARHNLRAVGLTIEALRSIERHGAGEMMEQAFTGFAQLPSHDDPHWSEVLGVAAHSPTQTVRDRFRELALQHHPDKGGDPGEMVRLNRAYAAFSRERGL